MTHRTQGPVAAQALDRCGGPMEDDAPAGHAPQRINSMLHVHPDVLLGTHVQEVIRRARHLMVHVTVAARYCCIR